MKIDPDQIYECAEIRARFPSWNERTLSKWLLHAGGWHPYPGSRKILIRGANLLNSHDQGAK